MEYIELNSLRKDIKKARSSQASISINICIELSKTFFPSEYRQVTETSAADIKKPTSLTKSQYAIFICSNYVKYCSMLLLFANYDTLLNNTEGTL